MKTAGTSHIVRIALHTVKIDEVGIPDSAPFDRVFFALNLEKRQRMTETDRTDRQESRNLWERQH